MISLNDIFAALDSAYVWVSDTVYNYLSSIGEILINTWKSDNNPIRGFTFDFTQRWHVQHHWQLLQRNYPPLLAAFVYAFVLLLLGKGIWYCVRYLCRGSAGKRASNEDLEEAKRWFMQAELDHQSSHNDMNGETPAYEWVCFKCHQAAEKAVKSALLSRHRTRNLSSPVHDLHILGAPLNDSVLSELVGTLQHIVGITSHMSYPNTVHHPRVPHEVYQQQEARNAWHITSDILHHVYLTYLQ